MKLYPIIGPPGTGKTTYLARQASRAVDRYGPQGALVASLTKAAAREAAGRDTGLDGPMIGTLHSHLFHALGRPEIVEAKHVAEWNERHPALTIEGAGDEDRDNATGRRQGAGAGSELLERLDLLRHRQTPAELYPSDVRAFEQKWTAFKAELELVDFTDLLELGLVRVPYPPFGPKVILVDEVQDHSRLELEIVNRWLPYVEHATIIGDPDQALYSWRGSSPDVFAGEPFAVLSQSYRVPRAIHAAALELLRRRPGHREFAYQPTKVEGRVERLRCRYRDAESVVAEVERLLAEVDSVMVLASCGFMLSPVARALRSAGIAYGNRLADRWSPLSGGSGVSSAARLLSFLRAGSVDDLRRFAPVLRARDSEGVGALERGGRKRLELLADDASEREVADTVRAAFTSEAFDWLRRDGSRSDLELAEWFVANVIPSRAEPFRYPLEILRRRGRAELEREPRVTLGTIHSVKGGESDAVLVLPDLSLEGYRLACHPGWAAADSIVRLFYVAFTRARHVLAIGEPSSRFHAPI